MDAAITSLQDVVDDALLLGLDRRRDILDATGDGTPYAGSLDVDLGSGRYVFTGREQLVAGLHFIGSAAPGPGSWMWGWHNVNGFADGVVARAGQVRDLGHRFGIPELTSAELPLPAEPMTVATVLGSVAGLVCGLPLWLLDAGHGTVGALLLESPAFAAGPPSAVRASTVLPEAAELGQIRDWSRALRSYATYRGFTADAAGPGAITLTAADGVLTCALDEHGRLRDVNAQLHRRG